MIDINTLFNLLKSQISIHRIKQTWFLTWQKYQDSSFVFLLVNEPDEGGDQLEVDVLAVRVRQTLDRRPGIFSGTGNVSEERGDEAFVVVSLPLLRLPPGRELVPDFLRRSSSGRPFRQQPEVRHLKNVFKVVLGHGECKTCCGGMIEWNWFSIIIDLELF